MAIIGGTTGHDRMNGTRNADSMSGGSGNDTIRGNAGNDTLNGDAGNDLFVLENDYATNGVDTITDYQSWSGGMGDTLDLPGALAALAKPRTAPLLTPANLQQYVKLGVQDGHVVLLVDTDGTGTADTFRAWVVFENLTGGEVVRVKVGALYFEMVAPAVVNNAPVITVQPAFTAAGVTLSATDPDGDAMSVWLGSSNLGSLVNGVEMALAAQGAATQGFLAVKDTAGASAATTGYAALGTLGADTLNLSARTEATVAYGFDGNDSITGGSGNDTIAGGGGNDTLDGGAASDTFRFAPTAAGNGNDWITLTIGSGNDVLAFANVAAGIEAGGGAFTGTITPFTTGSTADTNIAGRVALYAGAALGDVETIAQVAALFQTNDMSLSAGGKAVLVTGSTSVFDNTAYVWFVENDGTAAVAASEVTLVAVLAIAGTIADFHATNFGFYAP